MNTKEKIELIKRNVVEIINEKELERRIQKKSLKVYCGYEPSGEIHLGHLVTILKLLDFQKAGITPIVLLADWHAWLNKKGDWKFLENQMKLWKTRMEKIGLKKAKFIRGTSFQKKERYISNIMDMALNTTVNRGIRSMQTLARDVQNAKISQIIYPLMQIEDINTLDLDFVVGGLDQRKIHALGIELFKKRDLKKNPIFIHTKIITSLKGPGEKMSSSIPDSMISLNETNQEIQRKIKKAHCPQKITADNPILEIVQLILFPKFEEIIIKKDKKFGGNITYKEYSDLEKDFSAGKLHPLDLKNSVSDYIIKLIGR